MKVAVANSLICSILPPPPSCALLLRKGDTCFGGIGTSFERAGDDARLLVFKRVFPSSAFRYIHREFVLENFLPVIGRYSALRWYIRY